jgi:hypothetical protein
VKGGFPVKQEGSITLYGASDAQETCLELICRQSVPCIETQHIAYVWVQRMPKIHVFVHILFDKAGEVIRSSERVALDIEIWACLDSLKGVPDSRHPTTEISFLIEYRPILHNRPCPQL